MAFKKEEENGPDRVSSFVFHRNFEKGTRGVHIVSPLSRAKETEKIFVMIREWCQAGVPVRHGPLPWGGGKSRKGAEICLSSQSLVKVRVLSHCRYPCGAFGGNEESRENQLNGNPGNLQRKCEGATQRGFGQT